MKIKNAAAKILLPVMILSFLVSCASKKSGNTDIKQDTAQGTAQNSDAIDDDIPRNPYGDTDFSRPQGFDEKRDGVDYGYMNDRVIYYSSTIGKDKMCGVLLPAGYDEKKKYPVVYVLHGFGGDHFDWSRDDSYLDIVYGNMLVDGTAKPMIIVTVDMYTSEIASKETATGEQSRTAYDNFVNDLQNDLMPFIERTYSVKTGRENTGIIGTSQGGTECLAIGFIMQDKIGYISSLAPCPGVIPTQFNAGSFWNKPILEDFEIKSEEAKPVYLSLMVGSRDPWCLDSTRYYHQKLTEEGIKHDYFEVEGSGHDDDVWKAGLYNLFKRCF